MSQASGISGGGSLASSSKANKALPVLLLALAVSLGVALLHGLDDAPTVTEASLQTTQAAQETAAEVVPLPMTSTTLPVRSPSQVKVLVTNGTTTAGVAAKINSRLQPIGYQLGTPGNTTAPTAMTTVQFVPGFEGEAQAVATSLGLPSTAVMAMSTPAPVADLQSSNVVVVIGTELAAATAASNAAPTTAAGTSSANGTTATSAAPNAGLTGPLGDLSGTTGTNSGSTSGSANNSSATTTVQTN